MNGLRRWVKVTGRARLTVGAEFAAGSGASLEPGPDWGEQPLIRLSADALPGQLGTGHLAGL